jgi:hypothetical protein
LRSNSQRQNRSSFSSGLRQKNASTCSEPRHRRQLVRARQLDEERTRVRLLELELSLGELDAQHRREIVPVAHGCAAGEE